MKTDSLDISVSGALKAVVEAQAAASGNTPSDYVLTLIDAERKRQSGEALEAALLEGVNSGPSVAITEGFWESERRTLGLPPRTAKPS
ncbi:MAG TPA: hypothetical protein VHC19_02875 [Pirellulales bacterium]|nr:hypothetical protein [Pirellulales bacterium]